MAAVLAGDRQGGIVLSKMALAFVTFVLPFVSAGAGMLVSGYVDDKLRDRDVAEVRLDLANLVTENAEQIRDLTRRWQLEHDTIAGVAAQVGELDRRGASITARRDQQLETVYRRLDVLETAIGGIRTELAAINVRLDILLGRDGQRMREDMRTPTAVPPAMRAG